MNAAVERIREEARRYSDEVAGGNRVAAACYSFGIEMGLAIAAQAGPVETARILHDLRRAVYHGEHPDIAAAEDRAAAAIVGTREVA